MSYFFIFNLKTNVKLINNYIVEMIKSKVLCLFTVLLLLSFSQNIPNDDCQVIGCLTCVKDDPSKCQTCNTNKNFLPVNDTGLCPCPDNNWLNDNKDECK